MARRYQTAKAAKLLNTPKDSLPLPKSVALQSRQQLRILSLTALAAALLLGFALLMRSVFAGSPPVQRKAPPGTFLPSRQQLEQLSIAAVRVGGLADLVRANGAIAVDADHSTPILLPFSGQVTEVMVEAGQSVGRGQPLLKVASPELVDARNTLLAAAAQQATASGARRIAAANVQRQKAIYETAGGALKDYQQAQADLVAAQSTSRTAQSALRAAQDRLALFGKSPAETRALQSSKVSLGQAATIYRAPVSGTVADRNVAPGQFISAGGNAPLMTITDLSRVWLIAQLPEGEAANVRTGDQVIVTTPALPGREFPATVDNIAAALDPNTHRLPVRASVVNPGRVLKPQMFASFIIRRMLTGGTGVLIPSRAVIHEGDTSRVWVLGQGGLLYGREVVVGETEGGLTRILRGLRPGERIVTSGALFVNEAGLEG